MAGTLPNPESLSITALAIRYAQYYTGLWVATEDLRSENLWQAGISENIRKAHGDNIDIQIGNADTN